jgi:DNA-binding CsgD family transcriptional regulator
MTRRLAKHRTLSPGSGLGAKMLGAVAAIDWAYRGGAASDCVALARAALEGGELITGTHRPSQTVARSRSGRVSSLPAFPAIFVLTLADADEALETWDRALATGHRRGSLFLVSSIHLWRGFASLLRGDLLEAKSELEAAGQGYELYGYSRFANAYLSAFLASTLLASGDLEAGRGALDEFTDPGSTADGVRFWLHSRAELLLAEDRIEEALETADEIGRRNPQMVNPVVGQWRSIRMQALLRLGRQEEARTAAAENLELARRWGTPRAVGAALRTAGLVEGGTAGLALLEESVELLAKSPAKLEYATSEAELGAALRRANRRAQAREHLRRAVELATICGAAPLAARAETELLATGARPRRIALSGVDSLTPSERRVAEMAAKGPTNREIAQTLFVTPRTVEVHLSSVYRKLGISARSQLRAALARPTH